MAQSGTALDLRSSSERFPGSNPGAGVQNDEKMNAFQRSWEITKLSFDVIKKDKELILFPILGGIFSILFLLAMIFPFFINILMPESVFGISLLIMAFIIYFGLVFIATFFNVCAVYTIKTRFEGKNATFWDSIKFSISKIGLIFAWSIISATIGVILRILQDIAERMGDIGELIMKMMLSVIGLAWSLVSAFVIPGMIYKNIGPITALKDSVQVFKKTWGESLIRYYGLGIIQFLMILTGMIITIILSLLTLSIPIISLIIILIGVLYIILIIAFFNVANSVFNTALYVYATTGKAPKGYREDILKHAFERKNN
ncbi:MAG: hypothetical protein KatS3mg002_0692 [Candidatus Woesearchaeota archaeon]|nr:MAG: hypothetical protein KatS3mg002_0692 [Candidatus Woesearchaeota archaeon]